MADPRTNLPERFRQADAVTLPLAGTADPAVLARRIEAASGLAVRFAGDPPEGDEPSQARTFAGIDRLSPDGGIWTGPLDGLLDAWTGPAGYDWRYIAGAGEADRNSRLDRDRAAPVGRIPHPCAGRPAALHGGRLDQRRRVRRR